MTTSMEIKNHQLPYHTHNTYSVFFFGDNIFTTVTHDPAIVSNWISTVKSVNRGTLIVGLDVEWRPCFIANRQRNPVATIQICVGNRCLIYQIIHSPFIPQSLTDFLSDDNCTFVGVGVKQDLEKLNEDYGIGSHARAMELGWLAADVYDRKGLKYAGLKQLANLVLGKEMQKPKRVTLSNWASSWLMDKQVRYACLDAFVSFEIGRNLINPSS
ncbi:hypothetical protein DH2020_045817 [Rehmannia glutinosa]|uniref:3'-5' exonuclease domain-containing protein n=1 Tax=Rehmannia glutinosa TaxID=99300 RepID=A0ABR0UD38_REHGL